MGSIVIGAAGGQALVLLGTPVLTRLYRPADFGTLAVFTSVVAIAGAVATLRLDMAVGLPASPADAAAVAWSAGASASVVSVLVGLVLLAGGDRLARLLGAPELADMWWLTVLTVAVFGAYQVMSSWMARAQRYAAIGVRDFTTGLTQISVQIGLGLAGWKPGGLLLGFGLARVAGAGALTGPDSLFRQPRPTVRAMRRVVHRYRRFPLIASWSALLNTAGTYAPLVVVAACRGPAAAGLLGLAVRVLGAPSLLVVAAAARVFYGEATAAIRDRRPVLRQAVWANVRRLFLIGLVPSVALAASGPALFGLVFGPGWSRAGTYASILSLGNLARFAVGGVTQTLLVLQREAQQLRWDAARLLMTVGPPSACLAAGGSVGAAVAALSVAYLLAYGSLLVQCLRAAGQFDALTIQDLASADHPGRLGEPIGGLPAGHAAETTAEVRQ